MTVTGLGANGVWPDLPLYFFIEDLCILLDIGLQSLVPWPLSVFQVRLARPDKVDMCPKSHQPGYIIAFSFDYVKASIEVVIKVWFAVQFTFQNLRNICLSFT